MASILDRVGNIIVEHLGVDKAQITPSASFAEDLGADSLDLVELIMALEDEFSTTEEPLKISDEEAEKIMTVQDAVDFLQAQGIGDQ